MYKMHKTKQICADHLIIVTEENLCNFQDKFVQIIALKHFAISQSNIKDSIRGKREYRV